MDIRTTRNNNIYTKELYIEDKKVCRLNIMVHKIRIGTAKILTGGIAGLETGREYRNKGYARFMLEDSLSFMKNEKMALSMLMGIPNLYHKFGYAQAFSKYRLTISTRNAEQSEKKYKAREYKNEDRHDIARIYNDNNSMRNLSIIRENWNGFQHGSGYSIAAKCRVVVNNKNKVIGYVAFDDTEKEVNIIEVGYLDESVFSTLLNMFAEMAIKLRLGTINIFLPPDHPFAEYCSNYECDFNTHYFRNEGGMIKIIDINTLFYDLKNELERKIRNSRFNNLKTGIKIKTESGSVCMNLTRGKIVLNNGKRKPCVNFILSRNKLGQLVTGYRSIRDVIIEPDVKLTRSAEDILNVLFPKAYPYIWYPDWY